MTGTNISARYSTTAPGIGCKEPQRPEELRILSGVAMCKVCYRDFNERILDENDLRRVESFTTGEGKGLLDPPVGSVNSSMEDK
ncbi:20928_t:CDS:2 [Cetraspora pellucida]|uniref:20928_t:CDS:1 n=1 Tax=Cetraspora pellucida TaxID=1433469 RepID=A0A9N8ZJ64_9GLOM|nr:20928_t:CDS:2 [Cetraspora pellucida]